MSKDPSREIVTKLVYYLVVAKSSGRDYKYFKPKIVIIIYTKELASESLGSGGWKSQEILKLKIVRKKEEKPQ